MTEETNIAVVETQPAPRVLNINTIDQALEEAQLISDPFDRFLRRAILNSAVWAFLNNVVFVMNRHVIAFKNARVVEPDVIKADEKRHEDALSFLQWALTIIRTEDDVEDAATTVDRFIARQTESVSDEEDNLTVKYLVRMKKISEETARKFVAEERADTRTILDSYRDDLVRDLKHVFAQGALGGEEYFEPNAFQLRSAAGTVVRQCESQIDWNCDKMIGSSGKFKLNLMAECERLEPLLEGAKALQMKAERMVEEETERANGEVGSEDDKSESDESPVAADISTEGTQSWMQRLFG